MIIELVLHHSSEGHAGQEYSVGCMTYLVFVHDSTGGIQQVGAVVR